MTDEIKNKIKQSYLDVFLKNCVLTEDISLYNLNLSINFENSLQKINSIFSSRDESLKIKVFVIESESQKNSLYYINNEPELQKFITENNIEYKNVYACYDFIGNKHDLEDHKSLNGYNLEYNLSLPIKNKNYISLGILFYKDNILEATKLNVLPDQFNLELLCGQIQIFDLITDGRIIIENGLHDLSNLNKIFSNNQKINKLTESINFEILENKKSDTNIKSIDGKSMVSDIFYSTNTDEYLNFIFSIDYKKILEKNSKYSTLINSKSLEDKLSFVASNSLITSFKIIRREYESQKNTNKKATLKNKDYVQIIETQQKDTTSIESKENHESSIFEIPLFSNFKTVQVSDKTVFKLNPASFQYGIEMKIRDGFYLYIKSLYESLLAGLQIFKQYLAYSHNPTYFNDRYNIFNPIFIQNIFETSLKQNIIESLNNYVSCLMSLNLLQTSSDEIIDTFNTCLSPTLTNREIIGKFIESYEKLLSVIWNMVDGDSDKDLEFSIWFKKQYDTSYKPSYGYGYFYNNSKSFMNIASSVLESKIKSDLAFFTKSGGILSSEEDQFVYSASPSYIKLGNTTVYLDKLTNGIYSEVRSKLADSVYKEIQTAIFAYDKIISDGKNEVFQLFDNNNFNDRNISKLDNDNSSIFAEKTQTFFDLCSTIMRDSSITVDNLYNYINDDNSKRIGVVEKINTNINAIDALRNIIFMSLEQKKASIIPSDLVPFHISSILNNSSTIANNPSKQSLNNDAKLMLLYNTVSKIYFIEEPEKIDEIKSSMWQELNRRKIKGMKVGSSILCKVSVYQNSLFGLDNHNCINMPIYDEYFILQKNTSVQTEFDPPPTVNRTVENNRFKNFNTWDARFRQRNREKIKIETQNRSKINKIVVRTTPQTKNGQKTTARDMFKTRGRIE